MSKSETMVQSRRVSGVDASGDAERTVPRRPVRRAQAERSDATKRQILEATARLIVRKGYSELRVADVASEAGVSVGAQLHHFPSKDALLVAMIEHAFAQAAVAGQLRAASEGTVREKVRAIIDDAKSFFFSEHFLIATNIVLSTRSSAIRDEVLELSRRSRLPLEDVWRDAMIAAGIPEDLCAELLTLTLCIIRGFTVRRLWDDDALWQSQCLALWEDMIELLLASRERSAEHGKAGRGRVKGARP